MTPDEFEALLAHLDGLVAEFEGHPDPSVRERALELLRHVDAVHREGIGRLAQLISHSYPQFLQEAARDPVVGILLALYDLTPSEPRGTAFIPLSRLERSAAATRARSERAP